MISPTINTLLQKVDSKYTLVVAVAKRARQLVDGQPSLVDINSIKPVTIAIQEIAEGKLECISGKQNKQSGESNARE
ncbi:DNA-directed RNA polymerase subunit omega [Lutispora sp.]|uniref:DNA-directed RNA polymerase subunit omega n=1 Tax=Lutispora sp. TaxID=2828727 RepID=UPI000EC239C0|nr:DNA-directed RNA polymerase subunit omega [Lutispora sp.]MEA4960147.1 DNA-directed RNA polymerase subunit omega [Lutispora sp.]HCJ56299.1 DNA-directed RNA polymerase subunit omega [Clostridiaceae bacterium]